MPAVAHNHIYLVVHDESSLPLVHLNDTAGSGGSMANIPAVFHSLAEAREWRRSHSYVHARIVKLTIPNRRADRPSRADWGTRRTSTPVA